MVFFQALVVKMTNVDMLSFKIHTQVSLIWNLMR